MNIDQSCDVIRVLTEADWIFISWKLNTAICSLLTTVAVAWQQQTERTYRKCCRPTDGLHDASWWLWSELQLLTIQQAFYLTVSHKWSFVSVQQHFSFPPREQEGFTRVTLFSFTLKCCCWGSQRIKFLKLILWGGKRWRLTSIRSCPVLLSVRSNSTSSSVTLTNQLLVSVSPQHLAQCATKVLNQREGNVCQIMKWINN